MNKNRIFVEKRPEFRVEAESLRRDLNSNLGLNIKDLRLLAVYDLFGFSPNCWSALAMVCLASRPPTQ